mmetsp:Transcript_2147/g.6530  ORF Transcript_2147/g.6530 Transcript_2147/m.6530 type:complete len:262 (-) Transcript_2147:1535-2320(-)
MVFAASSETGGCKEGAVLSIAHAAGTVPAAPRLSGSVLRSAASAAPSVQVCDPSARVSMSVSTQASIASKATGLIAASVWPCEACNLGNRSPPPSASPAGSSRRRSGPGAAAPPRVEEELVVALPPGSATSPDTASPPATASTHWAAAVESRTGVAPRNASVPMPGQVLKMYSLPLVSPAASIKKPLGSSADAGKALGSAAPPTSSCGWRGHSDSRPVAASTGWAVGTPPASSCASTARAPAAALAAAAAAGTWAPWSRAR